MDTLVLNADAQPLTILPIATNNWKDSIKAMYEGTVDVLHVHQNWTVRSPSVELQVPSVIILRHYIKVQKSIKFSKDNIYLRDDYSCQYCGKQHVELTFDHVLPRHHGGKTTWTNIVSACMDCNHEKGHSLKYKRPIKVPVKPDYWALAAKQKKRAITVPSEDWLPYLDWAGPVTVSEPEAKVTVLSRI